MRNSTSNGWGAAMMLAAVAVSLSGCRANTETAAENVKIEGYGGLLFGMSLLEALSVARADLFDPASLSDCLANMPIDGCFLPPREDTSLFEMKAGIPYSLSLKFSRHDKLSDVSLGFHREGSISRADCIEVYERSIDWVADEFGSLRDHENMNGSEREELTTPGGTAHRIGVRDDEFFVGGVFRDFPKRKRVWPFATFIVVGGKPFCRISISFTDEALADPIGT